MYLYGVCFMLNFGFAIIGITLLSSAVILSKYIDFAKFMIERKDKDLKPRIIQFNRPKEFNRKAQQDIIIDIPVEEVKVLEYKGD
jgi:hypothetical protein